MTAGGTQFPPAGPAPARSTALHPRLTAGLAHARLVLEHLGELVDELAPTLDGPGLRYLADETVGLEALARRVADRAEGFRADYEARAHAAVLQAARGLMGGAR